MDQAFECLKISQVKHFNRRVTVAAGPRQTHVHSAVTDEIGSISAAIRGADLQRNAVPARDREDAFELVRRSYRRVVEAANHRTLAQRRISKTRRFRR